MRFPVTVKKAISRDMKRILVIVIYSILALFLGYLASLQVNGFLGIEFREKPGLAELHGEEDFTDTISASSLNLRLADLGGVGILPDTANWGNNYEHNVHRFEDLILPDVPYINPNAYQRIDSELNQYLDRLQSFNINGIVFPGFLEFVTFDRWKEGGEIYGASDGYRERHSGMQDYFGRWFSGISSRGMEVYLYTDMVALTTPLESYLLSRYGRLHTESKEFWEPYKAACEEIFSEMPGVSGIMIRIGEAGSIYNKPGWDYYSELGVRSNEAVRRMLEAFLEVAERHGKKIIFRTWSVGVGEAGDMHTNSETYDRVLGGIHSENLIVSTKYCRGDYYSWLPFNETLYQGGHRRIAEFQLRREFEGLNAFPNFMGPLYKKALLECINNNPEFNGIWLWTQEGGPLRAGPLSIFPFHGFNTITDLNLFAMGRLVNDPTADLSGIISEWSGLQFGTDTVLSEALVKVLLNSHSTVQKGLYISQFARYDVRALGLEPPPMLWIFEWDIVGGSPSVFSNIYQISEDSIDEAVAEGYMAAGEAAGMLRELNSVRDHVTLNTDIFDKLIASVAYEENLFETLAHFRKYILTYYRWLDSGGKEEKINWKEARMKYLEAAGNHLKTYEGNLDFPAYNFREADAAAKIAGRTGSMTWLARIAVLILLVAVVTGLTNDMLFSLSFISLSLAIFTSFSAPVFVLSLVVLTILYAVLNIYLKAPPDNNRISLFAPLLYPAVGLTGLLMLFTAWRGPTAFWHFFWSSSAFRTGFLMLFVLFIFLAYFVWAATLHTRVKINKAGTAGSVMLIQGILFAAAGGLVASLGFEKVLTVLNDELMILPGGLSRILGITTHLDIPENIPLVVMIAGLALTAIGLVFNLFNRKKRLNAD